MLTRYLLAYCLFYLPGHSTGFPSVIKPTVSDILEIGTILTPYKKTAKFQALTPSPSRVISSQSYKSSVFVDFQILVKWL